MVLLEVEEKTRSLDECTMDVYRVLESLGVDLSHVHDEIEVTKNRIRGYYEGL